MNEQPALFALIHSTRAGLTRRCAAPHRALVSFVSFVATSVFVFFMFKARAISAGDAYRNFTPR